MVTAEETQMSRQLSALKSPDLDQTALVQVGKSHRLPNFNSSTPTADVAFQGPTNSNLRVGELFKLPPPYWNIPYPTENPCLKNSQIALSHGLGGSDKPIDASCAPQEKKRLLIFDRSGNHTRLFFSPSFSPQNRVIASETPASTKKVESRFLSNPVFEDKWDENDLNDGEGEMLENTEEIDALLDSNSDDDDDNEYDEDNDEVTSTRHIPFRIEERSSPKRQRLLDGGYKKSSLVNEDDHESSYVGDGNFYDGIDPSKRDKKVKIHETLKILESIIPGSKSNKDPVSIIEEAIVYLETMRIEVEAFGLTEPESKSVTYT